MRIVGARVDLICLALVGVVVALGCSPHRTSILSPLNEQLRLHPGMQVEDVYKLVHQGAFGNEHLVTDESEARRYLLAELESVQADSSEQLVEVLNPNGTVVRVNLRPFKARGLDPQRLVESMLASAKAIHPDRDAFEGWWQRIVDAAGRGGLPWSADALRAFAAAKKADGYPAIHHSDVYVAKYAPAYRVLTSLEASKVIKSGSDAPK